MTNEEKVIEIMNLIFKHTMPKDQLGFFSENDLAKLILETLNK